MDNRAGGGDRLGHVRAAEAIQRFNAKMFAQCETGVLGQKCVAVVLKRAIDFGELLFLLSTDQQLRRRNSCQFVQE